MERRFEVRKLELIAECQVQAAAFSGMIERLVSFAQPFIDWLTRREQMDHAKTYLAGLLSSVERKNVESIAYLHDQDRRGLQGFIGTAPWEHQPLLDELAIQVGKELGEPNAVLVFDPSGFPKKGRHSVGVARQWCGRLGKLDNCQVGIYLGYVAREEQTLVDCRLYLPKDWANDAVRRRECGVPKQIKFRTRHQLALDMLDEQGSLLPHGWIAGDDEMGRCTWFRSALSSRKERYLLAIPSNTTIRDLRGRVPKGNRKRPFEQVRRWAERLPAEAWAQIDVRDTEKGPLIVHAAMTRVVAKTEKRRIGAEETLVVMRVTDESGAVKFDYYLSNAVDDTPLVEFARVAKAEHRIEECIQRAKSEAGLGHYEVRTWVGWHHHQTLSLIATWFLVQESRREKKSHTSHDRSAGSRRPGANDQPGSRDWRARPDRPDLRTSAIAHYARTVLPLETP
jgi:SRSO17 transposase